MVSFAIMKTHRLIIHPESPDLEQIKIAAQIIQQGSLVAFPTETVYGLGANALNYHAVKQIFTVKNRPLSDPLIVHIHSINQISDVAIDIPDSATRLANLFWPGPLTLILQKHPNMPDIVSAGQQTVAVRVPNHPVALALISMAEVPIAAPSANMFSRPSPTTANHVFEDFDGKIQTIIDSGPTSIGIESTVVDLTQEPKILRFGGIDPELLLEKLPDIQFPPQKIPQINHQSNSPGMMLKHYSPKAQLILFSGPSIRLVIEEIKHFLSNHNHQDKKISIMTCDEAIPLITSWQIPFKSLGSLNQPKQIANRLFSAMRAFDESSVDIILATDIPLDGLGIAIHDRLFRAAEGKMIVAMKR